MNCPKCSAGIEPSELTMPTRGATARALLLDWRVWVGTFIVMGLSSYVAQVLNMASLGTIVGGGIGGLAIGARMARLRVSPKCGGVIASEAPAA